MAAPEAYIRQSGPNVGANRPRGTPRVIDHANPTPLAPRACGPVQRLVRRNYLLFILNRTISRPICYQRSRARKGTTFQTINMTKYNLLFLVRSRAVNSSKYKQSAGII